MRASVHDETRFLPDQAVDPGGVQRDGVGLGGDAAFERRDEALAEVEFLFRAVGRVDDAVVDVFGASQLGSRDQLAVAHAAQPARHAAGRDWREPRRFRGR
ncbi:hypothetical protein G6F65_021870 [Rhizopus arrhizus]|nr:hypothetical protein G6F65_021870 [Rhizopus arrhizus]